MSELRAKWMRRGLIALGGAAVLGLVAWFAASRALEPGRMADWLEPRLSSALKRDVSIGSAGVRLIPLRVTLAELTVADPTGLEPEFASVEELRLRVRLLPLLRREIVVDRIDLVRPAVALHVGPDGTSNLPTLSDTVQAEGDAARPFSIDLRRITVSLGRFSYRSSPDSLEVLVDVLRTRSSVRRGDDGRWSIEGDAGARLGLAGPRVPALADVPLSSTFDLDAASDFTEVDVRGGTLGVEGIAFTLGGQLRDLASPSRSVDVRATIDDLPLERVLALAPDSVRRRVGDATGLLDARLTLTGPFGEGATPEVTGDFGVVGGRLVNPAGVALLEGLELTANLEPGGVVRPNARGRVLGGDASLAGVVTLTGDRLARLSVEAAPDLARLASVITLPEGTSLAGRLAADLDLDVPLDAPGELSGVGQLALAAFRVATPNLGVPVAIANGTVVLDGRRVAFADVPVQLGADLLRVSGEVADLSAFADPDRVPYLDGSVAATRLDATALSPRPPADTVLTYGRVAFAQLGNRSVAGVSSAEAARRMGLARPESLPLAGRITVAIDTLIDRKGRSEQLRAVIELSPDHIRVTDATLRRYGGLITTGIDLALGSQVTQPFTMRMRAEGVDATAFLGETTPLGTAVRGNFTADLDFAGQLDDLLLPTPAALVGGGRFLLSEGGLRASPLTERLASFVSLPSLREPGVRNWTAPFTVEAGALRLADSALEGAPGTPRVGGAIGFDGRLDLVSTLDLPRTGLDSAAIRRLGGATVVAQRALERTDLTRAVLRIGGTLTSPDIGVRVGEGPSVAEAVREEATREIRDQVEERRQELEQRATGSIRDLLRRNLPTAPARDTAASSPAAPPPTPAPAAPAQAAPQPDTVAPGAPPPDTVPPRS